MDLLCSVNQQHGTPVAFCGRSVQACSKGPGCGPSVLATGIRTWWSPKLQMVIPQILSAVSLQTRLRLVTADPPWKNMTTHQEILNMVLQWFLLQSTGAMIILRQFPRWYHSSLHISLAIPRLPPKKVPPPWGLLWQWSRRRHGRRHRSGPYRRWEPSWRRTSSRDLSARIDDRISNGWIFHQNKMRSPDIFKDRWNW